MIELHSEPDFFPAPASLVHQFKPGIPDLVERLTDKIQQDVPSFSGPVTGRRRRLISLAATGAIHHFLDLIQAKKSTNVRVDDLFRRMGYGEANDGNDLGAIKAAMHLATRDSWEEMRAFATAQGLSAADLGRYGDILFGYIDHLTEQVVIGYETALRTLDKDTGVARRKLVARLVEGEPWSDLQDLALTAGWTLPAQIVVLSASLADEDGNVPPATDFDDSLLVSTELDPAVIVCDASEVTTAREQIEAAAPGTIVARSWNVDMDEIADARRWTVRALALVEQGVIPRVPLVECEKYRAQIWLHAEPAIRRRLAQELLRPLLAETQNSREILSETLLAWLETRDSAPAIAARLGVHPQTVRYRWKRINELFGEALHDSEFVVQLTMLLKASVPLWIAGDQSDFERFRIEDARIEDARTEDAR